MKKQPTIWTVVFHFFVIVFAIDFLSNTDSLALLLAGILLLIFGTFGVWVRNKTFRILSIAALVIPAVIGSYYIFKAIISIIYPDTADALSTGYIVKENNYGLGNIGVILGFGPCMIGIAFSWNKWFSIREHWIYTGILILVLISVSFSLAPTESLNEWFDELCAPKIILIN